jgi:hypothetical protein
MRMNKWELSAADGSRILQEIGEGAARWDKFGHNLPVLEAIRIHTTRSATELTEGLIDLAFKLDSEDPEITDKEDIGYLFGQELPLEAQDNIVFGYIAATAISKLKIMQRGREFDLWNKAARLLVLEPGVRMADSGSFNTLLGGGRELPIDSVFSGRINGLHGYPTIGGQLELGAFWRGKTISGLVDIEDGHPKVDLEIFNRVPEPDR